MSLIWPILLLAVAASCATTPKSITLKENVNLIGQKLKSNEAKFDVKCWTSVKNIQNVLFGYQIDDEAFHRKEELTVEFASVVWRYTQDLNRNKTVLDAKDIDDTFKAIGRSQITPQKNGYYIYLSMGTKGKQIEPLFITELDLLDYQRTSNSWKTLYQLASIKANEAGIFTPLTEDGIARLSFYVDMFSISHTKILILRATNDNSSLITAKHINKNDRGLLINAQIDGWSEGSKFDERAFAQSLFYVDYKIQGLKTINGENSIAQEISTLKKIAKKEITEEVFNKYREILTSLTLLVWKKSTEVLSNTSYFTSGISMYQSVQSTIPYRIDDLSNIIFYPGTDSEMLFQEFDGDTIRDDGLHWKILKSIYNESVHRYKDDKRPLRPLDVYAAEELTEFISSYAVMLLKETAKVSPRDTISPADMEKVYSQHLAPRRQSATPKTKSTPQQKDRKSEKIFTDVSTERSLPTDQYSQLLENDDINQAKLMAFDAYRGVTSADLNQDGYPDLFLAHEGRKSKLLINIEGKKFEDRTTNYGLTDLSSVTSAQFVDFNNDNCIDLYVVRPYLSNLLFQNNCKDHFIDVTQKVGLWRENIPATGAFWFDANNDGLLDVYITATGDYKNGFLPLMGDFENAHPNLLYLQNKDGTFSDKTVESGTGDRRLSLAAVAFDMDNDGDLDLYVVNDMQRNILFENKGNGTFKDISKGSGTDDFGNGMGASVADIDGDGLLDIYLTNISTWNPKNRYIRPSTDTPIKLSAELDKSIRGRQANRLFINSGKGRFKDQHSLFIPKFTKQSWGWNNFFFDFNNDSYQDLFVINGFRPDSLVHHDEENFLLESSRNVFSVLEDSESGVGLRSNSRGGLPVDFDNDGLLDLIVTGLHQPKLYRNFISDQTTWLKIELRGKESNSFGIGARVEVFTEGRLQVLQQGTIGGGFVSSSLLPLHFGLGKSAEAKVKVFWPSGKISVQESLRANQHFVIREP